MSQSATDRRAERRAHTANRITAESRRLTARDGLNGFTIEQVCDEVGVSRRTFFNYFRSKEEAVLGLHDEEGMQRIAEHFLALGSRGWAAVVDDMLEVAIVNAEESGLDIAEQTDLAAAIEREPRLLARLMGVTRERERGLLELVAHREGAPLEDVRARAAVAVFVTVLHSTAERMFEALTEPENASAPADFGTELRATLAAARTVLGAELLAPDSTASASSREDRT